MNLFEKDYKNLTKDDFYGLLNIEHQEALLANMVTEGDNLLYKLK
jgi:hypothetical protein